MFIMNHFETMEAPKLIIVNSLKKENNKYHSQCNNSTKNQNKKWANSSLLLRRTVLSDRSDPCRPVRRSLLSTDRRSLLKMEKKIA